MRASHEGRRRTAISKASFIVPLIGASFLIVATPAWATCIAPNIESNRTSGPAGSLVRITGRGFAVTCHDIIIPGQPPPVDKPRKGIGVYFFQGSRRWRVGTVDANSHFAINVVVRVPLDAKVGPGWFQATMAINRAAFDVTGLARTGGNARAFPLTGGLILIAIGITLHRLLARGREPAREASPR